MYYLIKSVLIGLVCLHPLWAEQPYRPQRGDPFGEAWRFRSFMELDGKGLRCMTEDPWGTMWFGLSKGVRSYDGFH
ncbi:MAG: hypothetical protein O3B73_07995, partial [bacterium]|nr:hypothetical protein [bacterium]